jgi:hypothetical protein
VTATCGPVPTGRPRRQGCLAAVGFGRSESTELGERRQCDLREAHSNERNDEELAPAPREVLADPVDRRDDPVVYRDIHPV